MSTITLKKLDHGVCRLVIDSGKGNPLTPAFVNDLNQHLLGLSSSPPRALIIDTDGASIFGGGFALPIIASWKREELWAFFNRFMEGVHRILHLACPTITVVDGHAIAGGFIFSLASDFRVVRNEGIMSAAAAASDAWRGEVSTGRSHPSLVHSARWRRLFARRAHQRDLGAGSLAP